MRGPVSVAAPVTAAAALGLFAVFAARLETVAKGQALVVRLPWMPTLGAHLSFHLDGLSLLFALLVTGIGAIVFLYAGAYLAGEARLGQFYAFLLVFAAAMLGLVLADNVILLFVCWELTSLASYFLIGFRHDRAAAREAALSALLVTGLGGLALLAGLLLLAAAAGSMELSQIVRAGPTVRANPRYAAALVLVLLGTFTKSAQVPFHFWLPAAMEAPTPVSAYLHAATMVKAGVYLLARLAPVLGGTLLWEVSLTAVGAATTVVGAALALVTTDLKQILAYTTVSALGTLVMLLGVGTAGVAAAGVVVLLAHALYKGALFLGAGAIEHGAGSRDVSGLSGLRAAMPVTAATMGLAALALAGVGPVLSFVGKELALEALLAGPRGSGAAALWASAAPWAAAATLWASAAGSVALAGVVFLRPFRGPARPGHGERPWVGATGAPHRAPHEAPWAMTAGPLLLAALGVVFGLRPALVHALVAPAVASIAGRPTPVELALWHGLTPSLALSGAAVIAGAGLYLGWSGLRGLAVSVHERWWGPARWYADGLRLLSWIADRQTRLLQSGYLRRYLLVIIVASGGAAWLALARSAVVPAAPAWTDARLYEVVVAALILAAALAAATSPSRLGAVAALGVVGAGVSLIYALFGAPDLAMTQILVEALTVLLFVLAFYHLPRFARLSSRPARARDALAAGLVGALVAVLVLVAAGEPEASRLARYYAERSLSAAHGRNIVNVILVDFRGLDTLGEITVLATAATGVYVMLRLRSAGGTGR